MNWVVKFATLKLKTYSYLTDNNDENKKAKDKKKCVIKQTLKFEGYKQCLEATQFQNKINELVKIKLMRIVLKKTIQNSLPCVACF